MYTPQKKEKKKENKQKTSFKRLGIPRSEVKPENLTVLQIYPM